MFILKKIEERKRHKKEVARIVAGIKKLDSQQPDNHIYAEMEYRKNKYAKRSELYERLFGILKTIIFVPCIQIFRIASFICKLGGVVTAFLFFYGLYLMYRYFIGNEMVDLVVMIVSLVSPFFFSFMAVLTNYFADKMECNL